MENAGVFVLSTRLLVSMASKSRAQPGMRLDTMNPAMMNMNRGGPNERGGRGGGRGGMMMMGRGRGGRDALIDKTVTIIRGPHKGYLGIVKDASDTTARVELHTNCRVITVEKDKLGFPNADGSATPVSSVSSMNPPAPQRAGGYGGYGGGGGFGGMTPMRSGGDMTPMHPSGSRTPAWNSGSKTPAWNAGSKTPAWSASARTPNPYADGSQTPAWDAGSKTPRYGGSSTSAWDSGSRTPGPAWDSGSRTPARSAWGDDASTGHTNGSGSNNSFSAWGDRNESSSGSSGFPQTPAAGNDWMNRGVPTPGPFGAPSPAPFSGYPYTPGPSSYESAPTPSGNNFPATPAASSSLGSGAGRGSNSNGTSQSSVATPGATPGAGSRLQSIPTPGAVQTPQTPAAGSVAPMTPASHFPQTPFMPTGGDYSGMDSHSGHGGSGSGYGSGSSSSASSGPSYDWSTLDIEVKVVAGPDGSFENGRYNDMIARTVKMPRGSNIPGSSMCDIKFVSGNEERKVISLPIQNLRPTVPAKNDGVRVLAGEHRNATGTLMGVDVQDGIVSLRGENMYKVLNMSVLGKFLGEH